MMHLQLDDQLLRQLEELARKQGRDTDELVQEVLRQYVSGEADKEQFRARIQRHLREHEWLLNELAKR